MLDASRALPHVEIVVFGVRAAVLDTEMPSMTS
jgi:hypothetical protein